MGKVGPNHWSNDQRTVRTNLVTSEDKITWYTWFMRTQICVKVARQWLFLFNINFCMIDKQAITSHTTSMKKIVGCCTVFMQVGGLEGHGCKHDLDTAGKGLPCPYHVWQLFSICQLQEMGPTVAGISQYLCYTTYSANWTTHWPYSLPQKM